MQCSGRPTIPPQRPDRASGAASCPQTVRLYGKGKQQRMKRGIAAFKRSTHPRRLLNPRPHKALDELALEEDKRQQQGC
jgi:hypothetical protein